MRQGRWTGSRIACALASIASLACAASAQAAVTLPQSTGASGACSFPANFNTNTPPFPGTHVVDQGGTAPDVLVLECTTVTVPAGETVVRGPHALEIRASGAVTIQGVLNLSARPGISFGVPEAGSGGYGGGDGGGDGSGDAGGGPSGGGGGLDGTGTGPGAGGIGGPASGPHPGGLAGFAGATPSNVRYGGGGGGAGQGAVAQIPRGVPAAQVAELRGGSGGGGGGSAASPDLSGGGRGGPGGGAVRILSSDAITVAQNGEILAAGLSGRPGNGPDDGGGGGGGGAGGAINLIAPTVSLVTGSTLSAAGGIGGTGDGSGAAVGGAGRDGRIRVVANSLANEATASPGVDLVERYSVAIEATATGTGTGYVTSSPAGISCPPDCAEPFDPGASVDFTAVTDAGSTFRGWSGACAGTATSCALAPDPGAALRSLSAEFALVPSGSGGTGGDGGGTGGDGNGTGGDGGGGDQPPPPEPVGHGRPDLALRGPSGKLVGDDVYSTHGAQRAAAKLDPGEKAMFDVEIGNDGDAPESLDLTLPEGRRGFALSYMLGNRGIEPGNIIVEDLRPGEDRTLVVLARAKRKVRPGARQSFAIHATAQGDRSLADAVGIRLRAPR